MRMHLPRRAGVLISVFLMLAVLCFIFGNSLLDGEASNEHSGRLMEILKPLLDPHDRIPQKDFHVFVRKMAHFTEFFLLGVTATFAAKQISAAFGIRSVFMPLFFTLASAVTDEMIQNFTGRTSSVKDVLIDFSGAVCGLLVTYMISWLVRRRKSGNAIKKDAR